MYCMYGSNYVLYLTIYIVDLIFPLTEFLNIIMNTLASGDILYHTLFHVKHCTVSQASIPLISIE